MKAEITRGENGAVEYYRQVDSLPTVRQARQALITAFGNAEDLTRRNGDDWGSPTLAECLKSGDACGVHCDGLIIEFDYAHIYLSFKEITHEETCTS